MWQSVLMEGGAGDLAQVGRKTHTLRSDKPKFIQKSVSIITTALLNEALRSPSLPFLTHPLFWPLLNTREKSSPGPASGPRLLGWGQPTFQSPGWISPGSEKEARGCLQNSKFRPTSDGPCLARVLEGSRRWCGPSSRSFPHLEKQWEAKQEGTVSRASELWNVSGTCGWIRYHEGQGERLLLSKVTWSQTQHTGLGLRKRSSGRI